MVSICRTCTPCWQWREDPSRSTTVPISNSAHAQGDSPRLRFLAWAAGWPVLNGLPELQDPGLKIGAARDAEADRISVLEEGLDLLHRVWPEAWATAHRFLHATLLQPCHETHTTSISFVRLQGAFIASIHNPMQVGDAVCHEGSHTRLALFFKLDPLIKDDGRAVHPSPWRSDPRPLKGVLNGVHAFLNLCIFYKRVLERIPELARPAEEILEGERMRVREAWEYLVRRAVPTSLGHRFLAELAAEVERL